MDSSIGNVQHVPRKSSDELLRKFAEVGSESGGGRRLLTVVKRRRKRVNNEECDSPSGGGVVERKWLISPVGRKSVVLKKVGIGNGRSQQLRIRDFRNKSILGAIQKTWRRTVEGASKVLLEKHYNTHRRLISDIV
ncbi:hypothetical protein IC582_009136 [Cucumis melo]|uniref:Uncharacterized protein LOC103486764 n=2 Tax=Cucumis melo TaxID=3656 RepID=A0A1S3B7W3_CUCME|nr:uncharacterized protein LOC103486764 [Cucumis melo]KAA0043733.1 uncharacterized protein E6C27_scaffold236G00620 [Cucumis melo var. makuwa]TYK25399.1 uncharacterized protein E5676_scaffold352G005410 [Cucumis melo var. makuwa]